MFLDRSWPIRCGAADIYMQGYSSIHSSILYYTSTKEDNTWVTMCSSRRVLYWYFRILERAKVLPLKKR